MRTALVAALAAVFALPAFAETYEVGGRIVSGTPRKSTGFYVVQIPTTGTARILELVEDPNDATQAVTASPCGGFVPLTSSGGGRCITSTITVAPGVSP